MDDEPREGSAGAEVIDLARMALEAVEGLCPLFISPSASSRSRSAWTKWVDEMERVHKRYSQLEMAREVVELAEKLRRDGHWLVCDAAPAPKEPKDDAAVRLMIVLMHTELRDEDRGAFMYLFLAMERAWSFDRAMARHLLRRLVLDTNGSDEIWACLRPIEGPRLEDLEAELAAFTADPGWSPEERERAARALEKLRVGIDRARRETPNPLVNPRWRRPLELIPGGGAMRHDATSDDPREQAEPLQPDPFRRR